MDLDAIEIKLAAARTKLILDKPFLGALVLRLPMSATTADWCQTTATDARKFYYNPEYIDSLSMSQTQFMLAHEALHCALSHFARRQHRIQHRWDLACDYAINPLLIEDGLTPPPNCQVMPDYLGMTAEEIYPLIDENDDSETIDQHLFDEDNESGGGQQGEAPEKPEKQDPQSGEGDGSDSQESTQDEREGGGSSPSASSTQSQGGSQQQESKQGRPQTDDASAEPEQGRGDASDPAPPPLTNDERQTLEVQWQQRLAGAAQQAMQAGKMGGTMARLVDHLLQPQLPWRMLLARYMTAVARDDFTYMRPSRREGDAILPSLRSSQVELVVAIDTSGSIRTAEMEEFLSEVSALKGQMRARVTLLACDSEIAGGAPWVYEPWEEFSCPVKMQGGGGTDFRPVFDWLQRQNQQPELLVYFTDADGPFPKTEPNFPVIWLVKGKQAVPWGQRIQLN